MGKFKSSSRTEYGLLVTSGGADWLARGMCFPWCLPQPTRDHGAGVELAVGCCLDLAPARIQCSSGCALGTVVSNPSMAVVTAVGPTKTSKSIEAALSGTARRKGEGSRFLERGERIRISCNWEHLIQVS